MEGLDVAAKYNITRRESIHQIPANYIIDKYSTNDFNPIPYKYLRRVAHFPESIPGYYIFSPQFNKPTHLYTLATNVFVDCRYSVYCGKDTIYYFHHRSSENLGTFDVINDIYMGYSIIGYEVQYGHLINDEILHFDNLPRSLIENGYLLVENHRYSLSCQALQLYLNVTEPNVLTFSSNKHVIFCKYFMAFESKPQWGITGFRSAHKVVSVFKERLGVTDVEPTLYIISNRQPGMFRVIPNFKEISSAIINNYPHINWTIMEDYVRGLANTVIFWNTIKFIFGPNGSNMCNACFMRPGTVIVVVRPFLASDAMDNTLACVAGVWMFSYPQEKWEHWAIEREPANVTRAVQFVGCGLYTLENQKWPNKFPLNRFVALNESHPLDCDEERCIDIYSYVFSK